MKGSTAGPGPLADPRHNEHGRLVQGVVRRLVVAPAERSGFFVWRRYSALGGAGLVSVAPRRRSVRTLAGANLLGV